MPNQSWVAATSIGLFLTKLQNAIGKEFSNVNITLLVYCDIAYGAGKTTERGQEASAAVVLADAAIRQVYRK